MHQSIILPDESALAVFDTGNIVGDFACQLFPHVKEVSYSKNYDEMIVSIKELYMQINKLIKNYQTCQTVKWYNLLINQ